MATEVYTTEEIRLLDDTEVELRPLPIAKLRKFMRIWSDHIKVVQKTLAQEAGKADEEREFDEADLSDAQYDAFIKMCALGLESLKGDMTDRKFAEHLENVLDEKTIYRILDVTGGLKLGDADPNQLTPLTAGVGTN